MKQEIKERIEMIGRGEVPEGYFVSKYGILPADWSIAKLEDIATINKKSLSSKVGAGYSFCYIDLSSVNRGKISFPDERIQIENAPSRAKRIVEKNDVLVSTVRPNLQGFAIFDRDESCVCSTGFAVITCSDVNDSKYIYHCLYHNIIANQIEKLLVGSNYPAINNDEVGGLSAPLPPSYERSIIGEIISTWDKAIELKEQLIEEKKKLKKGLMQNLLTGRVRLPEFVEEWEETILADVLDYEQPTKYLVKEILSYSCDLVPVLTANKSFILGSTKDINGIYADNPVIIFDDFTTDNKYVDFPFKVKSSAIKMLKSKFDNIDLKYVYELMQIVKFPLGEHKRYYLSEYQYIRVLLPGKEEQSYIAKISKVADSEILLLEQELSLLKQQKKGLVQLLLTGIVRVPVYNEKEEGEQSEKQAI